MPGSADSLRCYSRDACGRHRPGRAAHRCGGERRVRHTCAPAEDDRAREVRRRGGGAAPRDDCRAGRRRRSRLGRRRPADAAGRITRIAQTARVGTMVALLSARLTVPVFTQDERLSSREAEERLSLARKGLAEAKGEARRGGGRGDLAGLPRCSIPDRAEGGGRGQRAEGER